MTTRMRRRTTITVAPQMVTSIHVPNFGSGHNGDNHQVNHVKLVLCCRRPQGRPHVKSFPAPTSCAHRSSAWSQLTSAVCRSATAHTSTFRCLLCPLPGWRDERGDGQISDAAGSIVQAGSISEAGSGAASARGCSSGWPGRHWWSLIPERRRLEDMEGRKKWICSQQTSKCYDNLVPWCPRTLNTHSINQQTLDKITNFLFFVWACIMLLFLHV